MSDRPSLRHATIFPMLHFDYLLFDWDGCLAKTLDIWLDAYRKIFAEFNIHLSDETITHQVFGEIYGPKKMGVNDNDLFDQRLIEMVNDQYASAELYEGVKETLIALKTHNKHLALVTTSRVQMIHPALEHHQLAELFDTVLTAENVDEHKPHPEVVEKAITQLGGDKKSAIIIGDSKSDLGAAQNAGIASILFYPEHNHIFYDSGTLAAYNPTYTVSDFKKILDILI